MNDETGAMTPALPEAFVRVQLISDFKAFKRHVHRMFDQGQPRYTDFYDADAEPWNLWPEMEADFVEGWRLIDAESENGRELSVIAMALTFSMPAGTDPAINEASVLAVARKAFAGHEQLWVAGEHEGPFVKMLVEYRDEDGRAAPSGPADLRRYRDAYIREMGDHGVVAQATTRGSRGLGFGETRNAYKKRQRLIDTIPIAQEHSPDEYERINGNWRGA